MASQKPAEPQAVPSPREAPSSASWLFLFYKWVTTALAGLSPGTAGNVIYSDGAGGVANEDAFNYSASTNALAVGSVAATTTLTAGTTVTAGTGITSTTGNITATAGNFVLTAGYLDLNEIADPGFATANHAWLHAEDVAGITQIHHNTATHKWAVGQDSYFVARNTSGVTIAAGKAVYVTGSTGARPEIAMADADLHHHAVGVTQDSIINNAYGVVVFGGYAKGLDTSAWTAGNGLYLSGTAGDLTTTKPTFPAAAQRVATVIYAHATQGILFVAHHEDDRDSDGAWGTPFSIGDGTTAGEVRLLEPSGVQYTAFKAQAQAGNVTYILPAAHATNGVMLNDGSGNLSWDTNISDLIDHGTVTGLGDDDHTQYALLAGRSGGQTLTGGTAASNGLTLDSTSDATKGLITLGGAGAGSHVVIGGGTSASELRFLEPSGSGTNYTAFKAQAQAANVTYTLPAADGSANQVLSTNGSATLAWATAGSGSDYSPMTPQGRLTLTTGTPVMTAEAAAQTTIYYTPYVGDCIPIYSGSWANTQFSELSIAMAASANWAANSNFDVFVYNDAGTLRLVTGAAWTNDTTRSEALVRTNGIWLNNASFTGRYGASSTVSIAASRATYVGTMRTSAAGTTTWELGGAASGGDPGILYLWNCYNRVEVVIQNRETDNSWTYNSATLRSVNNSTGNRVSFVRGLNEEGVWAGYNGVNTPEAASSTTVGFGLDSTSVSSGLTFYNGNAAVSGGGTAEYFGLPGLGYHFLQALEADNSGAAGTGATFYGDAGTTLIQTGIGFQGTF